MKALLTLVLSCIFFHASAQVSAGAGPDREICLHSKLEVTGSGLTLSDSGSYLWKELSSNTILSTDETLVMIPNAAGTRTYELTVTRIFLGNTYIDRDSFDLLIKPLPVIAISNPDTVCSSSAQFQLNNIMPPGNAGTWSGKGVAGRSFDPAVSSGTKQYDGPFMVKFTYTDPATGCSGSDSESLLIQTQPEILILNKKPYQQCENMLFNMASSSKWAKNIFWSSSGDGSFGNTVGASTTYAHGIRDTAAGDLAGEVLLTVSTVREGVCPVAKDIINLLIEPYPVFTTPPHTVSCEPAIVNFETTVQKPANSSNLRYSWDFGNGEKLQRSTNATPRDIRYDTAKNGWYDISLTVHNQWGAADSQACSFTMDLPDYVRVMPQPKAAFSSNPPYYTTLSSPHFSFSNKTSIRWGQENIHYLWNFDVRDPDDTSTLEDPEHKYVQDTFSYWVTMMATYLYIDPQTNNEHMCWDSISQPRKIGLSVASSCIRINVTDPNTTLKLDVPVNGTLKLLDINGRLIEERRVLSIKAEEMDISRLPSGIYVLMMDEGFRECRQQFIKY